MEATNEDLVKRTTGERIRKYLAEQPAWLKIGATIIGIYLLAAVPIMIWDLT